MLITTLEPLEQEIFPTDTAKLAKDHRTGRSLNCMCLIDHTEEAGQGSTPKKKEACTEADFLVQ